MQENTDLFIFNQGPGENIRNTWPAGQNILTSVLGKKPAQGLVSESERNARPLLTLNFIR